MKKKLVAACMLAVLALGLVGCGKKEVALADGKVVVGTNAEYEPFEYLDENGNITGFDYELMTALADKMGVEVEWVDMPFDSLVGALEAGNVELVIAAMAATEDRAVSCEFSDVYYAEDQDFVTKAGNELYTLEDLNGKTVAVLEGSVSDLIASGDNTDYGVVEDATVKRFKNVTQAIQELENDAADVVFTDKVIAQKFVSEREGLVTNTVAGVGENFVVAGKKGDTEVIEAANKALAELKSEGTYDEIYNKYFEN